MCGKGLGLGLGLGFSIPHACVLADSVDYHGFVKVWMKEKGGRCLLAQVPF